MNNYQVSQLENAMIKTHYNIAGIKLTITNEKVLTKTEIIEHECVIFPSMLHIWSKNWKGKTVKFYQGIEENDVFYHIEISSIKPITTNILYSICYKLVNKL